MPSAMGIGGPTRAACFAAFVGLTVAMFWAPLSRLVQFSFEREHYSHIVLVPAISLWLLAHHRRRIFAHVETRWVAGLGVLVAAGLAHALGQRYLASASENDRLSIAMVALVLAWLGGFLLCYGLRALRRSLFSWLFLFLMAPIPDVALRQVIAWLQSGSAEVSYVMFEVLGVPLLRSGFVFALPGVTIEIAQECSGIRSSLALLIIGLLAGHLFLRSGWARGALILASLPLLVVKNGIRIVTLTLLSIHVDPGFLTGTLHHRGGIVFFLVTLGFLLVILRLLQHVERGVARHRAPRTGAPDDARVHV
jgi:exosortase